MTTEPFESFLSQTVVLDTAGSIVYIGRLVAVYDASFVVDDADVHDCRDGHATKEVYVSETAANGVSVNRRQVVVLRSAVMSVSRLADVVNE